MKTIVLGLGNDLIGDDAVGILAARSLKEKLAGQADVIESSVSGIALMELLMDYQRAILVDAIHTGECAAGTINILEAEELAPVAAPSPHYAGLPEILSLAKQLQLDFPQEFKIFSIEVEDPYTIGGGLTPAVEAALPNLEQRVMDQVQAWSGEMSHA